VNRLIVGEGWQISERVHIDLARAVAIVTLGVDACYVAIWTVCS